MARNDHYNNLSADSFGTPGAPLSQDSLAQFNKAEVDSRAAHGLLTPEDVHERKLAQDGSRKKKFRCLFWIFLALIVVLAAVLVPLGLLVFKKKATGAASGNDSSSSSSGSSTKGSASSGSLSSISPSSIPVSTTTHRPASHPTDIPAAAKGTVLDPYTWVSTAGFNVTYTNETVGGLYVMGLNSTWDDSTQCNPNVPPLNQKFQYGVQPFRGVDLGGWFVLEPFITPSLFQYDTSLKIVDEYTLSQYLGPNKTQQVLEKHYATWFTEDDFAQIAAAGLDHVRIPYGYWAVDIQPGDTYLPKVSWRYLLRAIEWARKHGLRVNVDLHSVPGNANGWNHSGRLQAIGWLAGPNGTINGDITLEYHNRLSTFFAQDRYKNIVTLYGLVNEPFMTQLPLNAVLNWTTTAYHEVRSNGLEAHVIFGDGFRGLNSWQGMLTGMDGLLLDVHEYVIFNNGQLAMSHTAKVGFACSTWTDAIKASMDTTTGFGPTMVGEFGTADTDCSQYLNNINAGTRWEGTLDSSQPPACPNIPVNGQNTTCSCTNANADPSTYSDVYRDFLLKFTTSQMDAFENGYGWMYWNWDTETSTQWSYKKGMAAGIVPKLAYSRDWNCSQPIPDYGALGLTESY